MVPGPFLEEWSKKCDNRENKWNKALARAAAYLKTAERDFTKVQILAYKAFTSKNKDES